MAQTIVTTVERESYEKLEVLFPDGRQMMILAFDSGQLHISSSDGSFLVKPVKEDEVQIHFENKKS